MGEAKRRRFADTEDLKFTDPVTGEAGTARRAGDSVAWRRRFARTLQRIKDGERVAMQVPCGSCRSCCYIKTVEVRPQDGDDLAYLDTEPNLETGELKLCKRADGACIHLGPDGCSVYEHRPVVCRAFDCRMYGLVGIVAHWQDANSNRQFAPAWVFDPPRSQSDRIYETALRMAAWRYISGTPDWNVDSALVAASDGWLAEKALATRFVVEFDNLPVAEQRKAFEELGR
jgi:hypothetical protein